MLRTFLTVPLFLAACAHAQPVNGFRAQVEADWLLQAQVEAENGADRKITPETDAAGGCDGIKTGKWGFHTDLDENPWWQVDLGEPRPIQALTVWNRCDGVAERSYGLVAQLSDDAAAWRTVYTHDGAPFGGQLDGKPLRITLTGQQGRFVRLTLPGKTFLHLDEVEVFGPGGPAINIALHRPASQSSVSRWSANNLPPAPIDWVAKAREAIARCADSDALKQLASEAEACDDQEAGKALYLKARWAARRTLLAGPLLDFDAILFAKRVPGSFSHMSDQYYGWWSRPGGGLYILSGFKGDSPTLECISDSFQHQGSFMRPMLSYDGTKVLFAWCRHYPELRAEQDKLNKANVPEDAFYHVFEMNIDGTGLRQLTRGKYDDFDARYLPGGRIVFLSTRRGRHIQCGRESASQTLSVADQPDSYVRCGGGPERPVAVYTLHTMAADGTDMNAISPFEMFEWTPSVAYDGTILYSRWDYVDRDNMPYMSLWSIRPDGSNARIVYGNYTHSPHCTFEPRCIPGSNKIIFTASGHHAQTMGSLVLCDPTVGSEGEAPLTRLTPHVLFPEIEGWSRSYYAHPWPLSERLHLVSWGREDQVRQGTVRPENGMGIYLFDASGALELLHRDPDISCAWPIPVRTRERPPVLADSVAAHGPQEGRFLLTDVYRGLKGVNRGDVKSLRVVAVPAKTHPTMNYPTMGITRDDPGKCVLGTAPVEPDGSAYFRVPSGVIVFFQALDDQGMAIQTMRSTTHVQPGQVLSCIGCHESRHQAPASRTVHAAGRQPSKLVPGPEGSWPLRFDALVQPVLEKHCVRCHDPESAEKEAKKLNLTAPKSYESLVTYGKPSLHDHVWASYRRGASEAGACVAKRSALLAKLTHPNGHHGVKLDQESLERLITWMDTYAQRLGSFSEHQENDLLALRHRSSDLLASRN